MFWARLGGMLFVWVVLSMLEIALVGKLDPQETPVGIAIAFLATAALAAALHAADKRFALRASWLWPAALVARNVVRDTFVVFGVLFHRLTGGRVADAVESVPFDPGGEDALSRTRRGLVVAGVSTSPNGIVLSVDTAGRALRVHVLAVTRTVTYSPEWPM